MGKPKIGKSPGFTEWKDKPSAPGLPRGAVKMPGLPPESRKNPAKAGFLARMAAGKKAKRG